MNDDVTVSFEQSRTFVLMVVANTYATDPRVRREAKSLRQKFDVRILCWDRLGTRPSTEILDKCVVRNLRFGKTTVLVSSKVRFLFSALLFQAAIFFWTIRKIQSANHIILHSHDFNTLMACVLVKKMFKDKVRLVYDSHELTPGVYLEWYGLVVSRVVAALEQRALDSVDAVLTANEAISGYLHAFTSSPTVIIYNCPDFVEIPDVSPTEAKKSFGLENYFVVLFSGRLRQDYDVDMLLDATRRIRQMRMSEIKFVFTGLSETAENLVRTVVREDLREMFEFRGWIPYRQLLLLFRASDLCFAVTRDLGPNTKILTPIKLFESMACGLPVVVREGTLAAQIVQQTGCGIIINDTEELIDKLISLKLGKIDPAKLGASGRRAYLDRYNWPLMQQRLFSVYNELSDEV